MAEFDPIGFGSGPQVPEQGYFVRVDLLRIALHRVLNFTGRTIDDVIDDPIARNEVIGYLKLYHEIERRCDAIDRARRSSSGRIQS